MAHHVDCPAHDSSEARLWKEHCHVAAERDAYRAALALYHAQHARDAGGWCGCAVCRQVSPLLEK
jgi:hypothetical protein